PTGFVHGLDLRSQIAPSGVRTRAAFRLSAPQATTLALGLPAGSTLLAATIDGQAIAARSAGGDLVLPLPGRPRVDVVLHYRPAPARPPRTPPCPAGAACRSPTRPGRPPAFRPGWGMPPATVRPCRRTPATTARPAPGSPPGSRPRWPATGRAPSR